MLQSLTDSAVHLIRQVVSSAIVIAIAAEVYHYTFTGVASEL